MPEYKRKRVKKLGSRPKFEKTKRPYNNGRIKIQMDETAEKTSKNPSDDTIHVVRGKKIIRRRRARIFMACVAIVVATLIVLQLVLPVGLSDNVGNLLATLGAGSYPVELYGTTTFNTVDKGSYYYILTDSELAAVSLSGKKIYENSHGYANPVLKTSQTRALIFDQNGFSLNIYNLSGEVGKLSTKTEIITAAIARDGTYAVATKSDEYASVVTVYNRKGKAVYTWYSANELVNNIVISPNGKKIAVSTIEAVGGQLKSKLRVLEYENADSKYTMEFEESIVYSLENGTKGFFVLTNKNCSYITWSKFERVDYTNEKELSFSRSFKSGLVVVYNRLNDRSENHITVFSKKGKKEVEFDFHGIISDIAMSRGHIYCISETVVYMYDMEGKLVSSTKCEYGAERMVALSAHSVALISNSNITRLEISETKE